MNALLWFERCVGRCLELRCCLLTLFKMWSSMGKMKIVSVAGDKNGVKGGSQAEIIASL